MILMYCKHRENHPVIIVLDCCSNLLLATVALLCEKNPKNPSARKGPQSLMGIISQFLSP
jgi:hypothetical protein